MAGKRVCLRKFYDDRLGSLSAITKNTLCPHLDSFEHCFSILHSVLQMEAPHGPDQLSLAEIPLNYGNSV